VTYREEWPLFIPGYARHVFGHSPGRKEPDYAKGHSLFRTSDGAAAILDRRFRGMKRRQSINIALLTKREDDHHPMTRNRQIMAEKTQYNLRIERQLVDRLSRLATHCGYSSGNEFAAEALDRYAEYLAEAMLKEEDEIEKLRENIRPQIFKDIQPSQRK
jgi:hypothetical protein